MREQSKITRKTLAGAAATVNNKTRQGRSQCLQRNVSRRFKYHGTTGHCANVVYKHKKMIEKRKLHWRIRCTELRICCSAILANRSQPLRLQAGTWKLTFATNCRGSSSPC